MKFNKYLLSLVAVMASINAIASTIVLTQNANSYGDGGQFTAATSDNGTFETFCVDTSHYFTPGDTYTYTIGNQTYDGSGNYLTAGTAYLYSQFLGNTLPGFTENPTDAGLLQYTIWGLQNESTTDFNSSNPFYVDILNEFGSITSAQTNSAGSYGVSVMYLTDGNGNTCQSQLIETKTVPDSSNTLALALFGGVSLAAFHRKFNNA